MRVTVFFPIFPMGKKKMSIFFSGRYRLFEIKLLVLASSADVGDLTYGTHMC
jgi:hypothetical protein